MIISRLLIVVLLGYVLLPLQGSAATITYGQNNTPDTNPNTACAPTCPELTTAPGRGVFSLVSATTIEAVTFWTVESQGVYHGGTFNWRILADVNNAPGALFGSGQFSLTPHNSTGSVQVAGLTLDAFRDDFALGSPLTISTTGTYFLEIQDKSGVDTFGIFWATSTQNNLAFQLAGSGNINAITLPEPAGLYLAGSALLMLAVRRRIKTSR